MLFRNIKGLGWPALIVGSIVAFYMALTISGRGGEYRVLEFAVDLKPGAITSPEFRVGMKGHYEIILEAECNLPLDELNCLLGSQTALYESSQSVVDMEWILTSGNSVVASGASRNEKGGGGGDRAFRTLGWFDGLPRTPYVLKVNILRDGSALAPANPRIAVTLGSEDFLNLIIIPRVRTTFITVIAVIVTVWCWVVVYFFFLKKPDNDPADDSPPAAH